MQFAGLYYVFITVIMYTGGGGGVGKTVSDVFSTRHVQGSYSRPRAQFVSYKDLLRPLIICFLPSEIARLNLEKERRARRASCLQNIMSFC